ALSSLSSAQVVGSADMQVARQGHTATLLADGRIVLIGGENASGPVGAAEVYDPAAGTFSPAGSSLVPRADHTATLLADGRVLVAGGRSGALLLNSTEVFDPATGSFAATAALFDPATLSFDRVASAMEVARVQPGLRVLPDGKVQVIGGSRDNSMELFDPAVRGFAAYAQLLGSSTTTPVETILRARTRA